jgi:hypothetical protein
MDYRDDDDDDDDDVCVYTGCPRRNVPYFGRVFLMLKYTDMTQNTCTAVRQCDKMKGL